MRYAILVLSALALALPALAQSSASYRLDEHAFNAGGSPADGAVPASPNLKISLDAIGDAAANAALSGPNYRMDGGFAGCYPPPGETRGLQFTGPDTLQWDPERSVGVYNLYRDDLSALSGLGYGSCEQAGIAGVTVNDTDLPAVGDGFFYLVTAENRLGEEGTKGKDSGGAWRANPSPCP